MRSSEGEADGSPRRVADDVDATETRAVGRVQ
jgi:hypothetical protein